MRKRSLFIFLAAAFVGWLALNAFQNQIATTGAPPGYTGAPGEKTCAAVGCHAGSALNSGPGQLSIRIDTGIQEYEVGKIYPVTITLNQPNINRFGFEAVAVRPSDNKSAGNILITNGYTTQLMNGANQFAGKEYITYKYPGTNPVSPGIGEWKFDWKAPVSDQGVIVFYIAAVAANDDAAQNGDLTYTATLQLNVQTNTQLVPTPEEEHFQLYPNPAKDYLIVRFATRQATTIEITWMDLHGKIMDVLAPQVIPAGIHHEQLLLRNQYEEGLYLLHIRYGNKSSYHKVVLIK